MIRISITFESSNFLSYPMNDLKYSISSTLIDALVLTSGFLSTSGDTKSIYVACSLGGVDNFVCLVAPPVSNCPPTERDGGVGMQAIADEDEDDDDDDAAPLDAPPGLVSSFPRIVVDTHIEFERLLL